MTEPTVHILLASYNGQAYLTEQLESIATQTWRNWSLLVSDDGSTDHTRQAVTQFASKVAQPVALVLGPCKGVTHNFFHLIHGANTQNEQDLYAFCDQDDVWLPSKLQRAVAHYQSQTMGPQRAYLYSSATHIVDAQLKPLGTSPVPQQPLGFGNALLQNIASGNTMVFNHALLCVLRVIRSENSTLHDWSAYQAVSACGGLHYHDPVPSVLYRQHRTNLIGSNTSGYARLKRLHGILRADRKQWANQTEAAMHDIQAFLSPAAATQLQAFSSMRRYTSPIARIKAARAQPLWTQKKSGQLILLGLLWWGLM